MERRRRKERERKGERGRGRDSVREIETETKRNKKRRRQRDRQASRAGWQLTGSLGRSDGAPQVQRSSSGQSKAFLRQKSLFVL